MVKSGTAVGPPGSWTWASFAQRLVSPLRRQEDEDLQRPGELRAVHRQNGWAINAAGLQFLSRILPLEAEGTAGGMDVLHCAASHGHWRFSRVAEEIHTPDRAAQDTGEGGNSDYQDLGLEVDDDDPTDRASYCNTRVR